ncbi:MAG: restriction endonuclease, partial [Chloroflexota bacterium]
MKIAGIYSFNKGEEVIEEKFANELKEVQKAIKAVKSSLYKTKVSDEKTMLGKVLYDPGQLNKAFV